jgi:hypothetical protein
MARDGDEIHRGGKKQEPQFVNAIVFVFGFSCFTFAVLTVRSILLVLSVFAAPFSPVARRAQADGRCLRRRGIRRAGH